MLRLKERVKFTPDPAIEEPKLNLGVCWKQPIALVAVIGDEGIGPTVAFDARVIPGASIVIPVFGSLIPPSTLTRSVNVTFAGTYVAATNCKT